MELRHARPADHAKALAAWTRYVEFMVEANTRPGQALRDLERMEHLVLLGAVPNLEHYLAVARAAIPAIRKHPPEAKIMLGSWAGFPHGIAAWSPEQLAAKEQELVILQATRHWPAKWTRSAGIRSTRRIPNA